MARDLTNFDEFPGALDDATGWYTFPTLWKKDELKRWREWTIFIRLIKSKANFTEIDFDLTEEKEIPIKESYFQMGSTIPGIAQAFVKSGISGGKITLTAPTYFDEYANEGRANQRNPLQSAMIWARALWLKKIDEGSAESKTEFTKAKTANVNREYLPMLAEKETAIDHIDFPAFVQPKLDGMRALVYLKHNKNPNVEDVVAYSRRKKPLGKNFDKIKKILLPYLVSLYDKDKNQSIYLDGEIYLHGKKLQEIIGDARGSQVTEVQYHIYDVFYPMELETDFEERLAQRDDLFDELEKSTKATKHIKRVPTRKVTSLKEAYKAYDQFVQQGYEGAMLRNFKGPYLVDKTTTRSKDLVKLKPTYTDEFELIGYTDGKKGRDVGAIIWVCQTKEGLEFNATPKDMTIAERKALFQECKKKFKTKYLGRMLTVEYQDMSKDLKPQRAKALLFRDYE